MKNNIFLETYSLPGNPLFTWSPWAPLFTWSPGAQGPMGPKGTTHRCVSDFGMFCETKTSAKDTHICKFCMESFESNDLKYKHKGTRTLESELRAYRWNFQENTVLSGRGMLHEFAILAAKETTLSFEKQNNNYYDEYESYSS